MGRRPAGGENGPTARQGPDSVVRIPPLSAPGNEFRPCNRCEITTQRPGNRTESAFFGPQAAPMARKIENTPVIKTSESNHNSANRNKSEPKRRRSPVKEAPIAGVCILGTFAPTSLRSACRDIHEIGATRYRWPSAAAGHAEQGSAGASERSGIGIPRRPRGSWRRRSDRGRLCFLGRLSILVDGRRREAGPEDRHVSQNPERLA